VTAIASERHIGSSSLGKCPLLYTPWSTCSLILYILVLEITNSTAHESTSARKSRVKGARHLPALNWRIDNAGGLGYSSKSRRVGVQTKLKSMHNSSLHIMKLVTLMCRLGFIKFIGPWICEFSSALSILPIILIAELIALGHTLMYTAHAMQ